MSTSAPESAPLLECDIVMKGGITSGIIYPGAAVALSRKYRFRQIGGASAGAIAATMAAAAELGRRRENESGNDVGASFAKLGDIPTSLGTDLPTLFQPSSGTAAAFDVMMAWLEPNRSMPRKLLTTAGLLARRAWPWFVISVGVTMVPAVAFDVAMLGAPRDQWWALTRALMLWIPVAVLVGLLVSGVVLGIGAIKQISANGFGLCNGFRRRTPKSPIALTEWMEERLRDLAGPDPDMAALKRAKDRPVCFGDLWGEAATQAYRAAFVVTPKDSRKEPFTDYSRGVAQLKAADRRNLPHMRTTDCLVITTDLSHRRPYRFPFDTQVFFWCKSCFGDYFPVNVVEQMVSSTVVVDPVNVGAKDDGTARIVDVKCSRHPKEPLRYMPLAPDIPLVVAARLSLSFPGLLSAVPLQAIDWTRSDENRDIVTVWFSDGGIASNFPMRFFDSAWPTRPTFGISLSPPLPDYPEMVWRPRPGGSGVLPTYVPFASLGGFVGSILDTMQNWNDNMQITMPGFRDRIVVVRQNKDEGGMNLKMPMPIITGLADRGQAAGENITLGVKNAFDPQRDVPPFDFATHRWIRYRDAMAGIDELLSGMRATWEDMCPFITETAETDHPYKAGVNDLKATLKIMELVDTLDHLNHPATIGSVPRPEPELRLTPPL